MRSMHQEAPWPLEKWPDRIRLEEGFFAEGLAAGLAGLEDAARRRDRKA